MTGYRKVKEAASDAVEPVNVPRSAALKWIFAWPILKRSLGVALVVGTALNLINQGDALYAQQPLVLWKLGLTYAMPFAVSSYGSFVALRST